MDLSSGGAMMGKDGQVLVSGGNGTLTWGTAPVVGGSTSATWAAVPTDTAMKALKKEIAELRQDIATLWMLLDK